MTASPAQTLGKRNDHRDLNSNRASRRRAVLRTVHDVREQLNTQNGYRPTFRHELSLMYVKNRTSSGFALPMLFLIVGAISTLWAHPGHSLCLDRHRRFLSPHHSGCCTQVRKSGSR